MGISNWPFLLAWGSGLLCAVPAGAADEIVITVDAGHSRGEIRPLHDLHSAPLTMRGAIDLASQYKELGVRYVRIHDAPWTFDNAVDMHMIFPRFDADPDDPRNYLFAKTDEVVASVKGIDGEIIFRLGESAELANRRHNRPPADYDQWTRIAVNIIRHYNEGWADGFEHGIRYWEIWNEPDIPNFWTGSPEDYFRLYETAVRAIKQHDPELKVGGPALAANLGFLEAFLAYCRERDLPVDFISWHSYSTVPAAVAERAREVRALADRYGYTDAETQLTEWNYFPGDWDRIVVEPEYTQGVFREMHGPAGAAYAASLLIYLQDTPLDVANFYTGTTLWYGLFDPYGVPHTVFHAFRAFRRLFDTPVRVDATGSDGDAFAVWAGRAEDDGSVQVLVGNLRRANDGYRVVLDRLPWEGPSHYDVWVIDKDRRLESVARGILDGNELEVTEGAEPPSVVLIRIEKAAPAETP